MLSTILYACLRGASSFFSSFCTSFSFFFFHAVLKKLSRVRFIHTVYSQTRERRWDDSGKRNKWYPFPWYHADLNSLSCPMPHSHQDLNTLKSCLVRHTFLHKSWFRIFIDYRFNTNESILSYSLLESRVIANGSAFFYQFSLVKPGLIKHVLLVWMGPKLPLCHYLINSNQL